MCVCVCECVCLSLYDVPFGVNVPIIDRVAVTEAELFFITECMVVSTYLFLSKQKLITSL